MKKFYLFSFLFLCFISSLSSLAQTDPYPYRGLYVDKFLKVSNPSTTILGQASKEDSLLRFARDNDFKYLILYDVEGVLDRLNSKFPTDTSKTYSQVFCNFIQKAKTQYCIEHIGVSLSAANYFDSVGVYNTLHITQPYTFNSGNNNFFQAPNPNPLAFVQVQDSVQQQSQALITEMVKTALRLNDFNSSNCVGKVDVMTTEYEFWQQFQSAGCLKQDTVFFPDSMTLIYHGVTHTAPYSMTLDNTITISIPNDTIFLNASDNTKDFSVTPNPIVFCRTNEQFWDYRQLLQHIDTVRAHSTYRMLIDTYLGWFGNDTINDTLQTDIIDSCVNRIGLHSYRTKVNQLWSFISGRVGLFGHNHVPNTVIHPIISAEPAYLGPYLTYPDSAHTIFEAEGALISNYNSGVNGDNTPLNYGAFNWFDQSKLKLKPTAGGVRYLDNVLFLRPTTTCSGQNVNFNYIGPNEPGNTFVWEYADGNKDSLVNPSISSQDRNHVFNNGGTYIVSCTLYYPAPTDTGISGCTPFTYRDTVFINGASITATGSTSICQGDSVRLTASSGTSYVWTGGATTQSIYAKVSGTYSVTVANSNGCASSTATINITVHPKPTNSLSIVSVPCLGGTNGVILATTAGGTSPYHYLWSNGTTTNPLDTISAGTYFVTVTDSFGCIDRDTISLSETLTCCGMGQLNAPSIITSLTSGSSYNVSGNVIISGNVSVSNTRFYMGDNSQITISSGSTLTMTGCHLSACDSMWNGISFTDNTSILILNTDTIEDAFQAISDSAGARITATNSVFNKNRRGILIVGSFIALTSVVSGCAFTCQNSNGSVAQTKDGSSAYSGIEVSDMNGWNLSSNHFYHLFYGVKSENSSISISGCTFNDMRRYNYTYANLRAASWTWVNDGYGVYSNNSTGSPFSLTVQGSNFANCGYGVAVKNSVITEVASSTFDSLRYAGVSIANPSGVELNIHNNYFTHYLNGISVSEPRVATNTLIHDNTFTTTSNLNSAPLHNAAVNWSVKLQNRLPGVTIASVTNNRMNDQLKGVYLNGCEQVDISLNNIQLIGSSNTNKQYGIWLVNSANCTLNNDSIIVPTAGISDPTHARGIRFESSTGCSINNNYLQNLGSGINGLNFCDLTTLCGNDIWNCVRGIDVFNVTLPAQGAVNSPQDNMWRNIPLASRTVGSTANFSPITFYHRYTQNNANNKFSPGSNINTVQSIPNVTGLSPCSVPDTLPQMFTEITDQVIKDSIVFISYNPENKWFAKDYAFHLLSKDSMLMNLGLPTDQQRKDFFDELKERNVGELEAIHDALNTENYLQAITMLINIQPENVIEQNLKDAFNLVEKVQTDEPLTIDDSLLLDNMTEQLAFEGGPGVFIARAIMDEEYDDEVTGSLLRQINTTEDYSQPDITLYPNPSDGKIVISKKLSQYGACRIDVRDIHGRLYLSSKLNVNEALFEKDLSFLKSGIYTLFIYCDEQQIESLKLIIQK